jgi:heme/copper-type cytochrome/quinol oxidase subunit 3
MTSAGMAKSKLGVITFIASEANFFLLLIFAYVYYHGSTSGGPGAAGSLDRLAAGFNTVFLLASSATMWRAERSLRGEGAPSGLPLWLLATIVLGAIFLFGQGREYAHLIRQNVTISRDLFGASFFTLTGFHGLHVLIGLITLSIVFGLSLAGDFSKGRSDAVEAVALYWHFVDAVWIVIFSIIYLWTAST